LQLTKPPVAGENSAADMRQLLVKCSRAVLGWPPQPTSFARKVAFISTKAGEHGLKVLVETGTFLGEMLEAQSEHFDKLISIELNQDLYQAARSKFAAFPHIRLIQGDSGVKLGEGIRELKEPALFWLDAHYSAGITAGGGMDAPIIKELSCLASRNQPKDMILIDDARLFGWDPGYPKLKVIRGYAAKHWPKHAFSVESDIICIAPPA